MNAVILTIIAAAAAAGVYPMLRQRLELSRAKHPSLEGHSRLARLLARMVPGYSYDEARFFAIDNAPADVAARRRIGMDRLSELFRQRFPRTLAVSEAAAGHISDMQFTGRYRVPFQFSPLVRDRLQFGSFVSASSGVTLTDLDGNEFIDLTGSYGVNVFGNDFYKACIAEGAARVEQLGPVLGSYHPLVAENAANLCRISRLDEVSFHMSGTEAVMQAVRLARFHTGRSHLVRFAGAYHGWWEDVQPGPGSAVPVHETYTLREMDDRTLKVLRRRSDIACVLVNPLQALHPNRTAPGDSTLIDSSRNAHFDRDAYARWLRELRAVCDERGIVLIFDEVFVGFRLAPGGAQEYFDVRADMVTYGKTLGGGLPVGVVCGRRDLMRRFKETAPANICFARGTFNSHPYVMGAMSVFLERILEPEIRATWHDLDSRWNSRAAQLNQRLYQAGVPVKIVNLASIWTITYTRPSCYNWMLQFYLRAEGLMLSWVGSGRLIFSHNFNDDDFDQVIERFVRAASAMHADGWWWADHTLDNGAIRKRILHEMIQTRVKIIAGQLGAWDR